MSLELEIKPQPLTDADRLLLVDDANASPFIAMLTPRDLKRLERAACIFYYYAGDQIVGFGAWQPVGLQWAEIGPFFNRDAWRGQGLGRRMFYDIISHLEAEQKSLYAVTKNDAVKHMLEGYGFAERSAARLPPLLLLHLVSRFNVRRIYHGVRKMSRAEPTIHLVKPFPYQTGPIP
jgi:GNAT superfamily N-acetyltransferase